MIYVHKGRASTSSDFGGVSALPEIGFRSGQAGQTNSYFARYLSMADLNQDGKVDIIASEQDHSSGELIDEVQFAFLDERSKRASDRLDLE